MKNITLRKRCACARCLRRAASICVRTTATDRSPAPVLFCNIFGGRQRMNGKDTQRTCHAHETTSQNKSPLRFDAFVENVTVNVGGDRYRMDKFSEIYGLENLIVHVSTTSADLSSRSSEGAGQKDIERSGRSRSQGTNECCNSRLKKCNSTCGGPTGVVWRRGPHWGANRLSNVGLFVGWLYSFTESLCFATVSQPRHHLPRQTRPSSASPAAVPPAEP